MVIYKCHFGFLETEFRFCELFKARRIDIKPEKAYEWASKVIYISIVMGKQVTNVKQLFAK